MLVNVVYGNQFRAGSSGALSSGGWGLANPVVPGGASLLASLVSIPCIVVTSASSIAALRMKEMTAIIQRGHVGQRLVQDRFSWARLLRESITLDRWAGSAGPVSRHPTPPEKYGDFERDGTDWVQRSKKANSKVFEDINIKQLKDFN